jgi:hypothetical protein
LRAALRVRRPGIESSRRRVVRADGRAGQPEDRPAQQVVREAGDHRPGRVGAEQTGREVRQGLVFEVADHLLDDGVLAMLGLHCFDRFEAFGREREAAPLAGEQLALGRRGRTRSGATRRRPARVLSAICASRVSG